MTPVQSAAFVTVLGVAAVLAMSRPATAQLRILDYNVAATGSASSGPRAGMDAVLRAIGDQNRPGFAAPIGIMLLQEGASAATTGQSYADLLNTLTSGTTYRHSIVDGATTGGGRPLAVYDSAAVTLISEQALGSVGTAAQPRQTMRYQFRPVGYDATTDFYVYNSHLKSSNDSTSAHRRDIEATVNRLDADSLGDDAHVIYVGDLNLYSASEAAFQTMVAPGSGQAFDPLGAIGAWSGNALFKTAHTQSPATSAAYGGQVTGGLNDRFDFQLVTHQWLDGRGLDFIPGSYWAFGNTGSHVMSGPVTTGSAAALQAFLPGYTLSHSETILTHLSRVTDHLPVVADYQLPARMTARLATPPATVITGAVVSTTLSVANSAAVGVVQGADRLDYGFAGSGILVGSGTGSDLPLGSGMSHGLSLDTSLVGLRSGTIAVVATSPQAGSPAFLQTVTTGVLDHARGSFSAASSLMSLDVDFGTLTQGTGPSERLFGVFNLAGSLGKEWTAKLDLDGVAANGTTGVFTTTLAPFVNLESGSSRTFGLSMLTTTTGSFAGSYLLSLSDQDLPGATAQTLSLTVRGFVVSPASVVLDVPTGTLTQADLGFTTITGTASVVKTGGGTILVNGINTFTGSTTVEQGVLAIDAMASIGSSARIDVAVGAGLDVSGVPGGYSVPSGQVVGGAGTVMGSMVFGRGATLSPGGFGTAGNRGVLANVDAMPAVESIAVPEPGYVGWLAVAGLAMVVGRRGLARCRPPVLRRCGFGERKNPAGSVPPAGSLSLGLLGPV